ncbi:MAG: GNAT family N-acetyltransferase [Cyclobacteriaceae bacterium]
MKPASFKCDIRSETPEDYTLIDTINDEAFGQPDEGLLIRALRKRSDFIPDLSLVAWVKGNPIGHVLFTPIEIHSGEKSFGSLALAPMAVRPQYQKKGVGTALVAAGIEKARQLGFKSIIVLGHPKYYPRFGFRPASLWSIKAPFEVSDDAFMALELTKEGLEGIHGTVAYPEEFQEV